MINPYSQLKRKKCPGLTSVWVRCCLAVFRVSWFLLQNQASQAISGHQAPCVSICLQGTDWCSVIKRRFSFSPTDYAQQPQLKFNRWFSITCIGLPGGISDKESACQCRRRRRCGFSPWVEKILWRRKWQPTSLFLPGKSHGQRSLVGYSPWGLERVRQLSN